jgi:type IV pilus assembly protein PilX
MVNTMAISRMQRRPSRERGVVLITGLIFLVVLTMIVLSVMRGSTLEERMAANARNRQLALQAAEAVSRDAGVTLFTAAAPVGPIDPFDPTAFTAACTGGYCEAPASPSTTKWKTIDWTDAAVTRTFASSASNLNGVTAQPRYIVEPLGFSGGQPGKICPKILFRVSARGVAADSSVVFVETMYRYRPATFADGSCG